MPTTKKKVARPTRRRVRRRNGGGTIAQLKKWVEVDFGRKFASITRIVDRPRKAIIFKMWGPTMMYTIEAWEAGAKLPRDGEPRKYDGIMASFTQRFYQDGEDWHRGRDLSGGPLEKATWDRISAEIRQNAIHTLPAVNSSFWRVINKGTARDIARLDLELQLTPTLKRAEERRKQTRGHVKKTKLGDRPIKRTKDSKGSTKITLGPKSKKKHKAQKRTR